MRKRMGNDRDSTNPDQWKAAIDSYADRFTALGLQPPKTSVIRGKGHAELWRLLHDKRRRVIAAIGYGTVASERCALWASRSFRGNHAVYLAGRHGRRRRTPRPRLRPPRRRTLQRLSERSTAVALLARARRNGQRPERQGRRLYPGEDRWIGLVISKARPIGEPDDGVDPGDPDAGISDLPDVTELLEFIADTRRRAGYRSPKTRRPRVMPEPIEPEPHPLLTWAQQLATDLVREDGRSRLSDELYPDVVGEVLRAKLERQDPIVRATAWLRAERSWRHHLAPLLEVG